MSNKSSYPPPLCSSLTLETTDIVVSYLFFFMFPIALSLNGMAAWVSLHLRSTSTFIIYLKNLVASDLLLTLTIPPMAASLLPEATNELKTFNCRYTEVVFYCCLYTGIGLMGLISLDRFFKIVRPCGKLLGQHMVFSIVMSSSVWVLIFGGTAIPTMIMTDQNPDNNSAHSCMSLKSQAAITFHVLVVISMESLFWIVSIMIVFCYICITAKVLQSFRTSGSSNSQGKKKTKLRVFLILFVFFICFLPLHVMRVPFTLERNEGKLNICTSKLLHKLALWVSTTNACLDPILYIYLCRQYRNKLFSIIKSGAIEKKNNS
ncbi:P2Y purinoceptor 12-like [Gouania willdenowi]|uniref:P2Y purinoceptor 12-like n=1 Tax=Gouania willdenowi TaxID=441366 RepID=UPI0010551B16|nr:P2Y purinoceptor 12-like [Gouania willdenowi]